MAKAKETKKAAEAKTPGQELADKLFFTPKNAWEKVDDKTGKAVEEFAAGYRKFLDAGKTEREFTAGAVALLEKKGFIDADSLAPGALSTLKPGAKVYRNIHGKSLLAAITGRESVKNGVNILGAHIDSPRIDLKQSPLYEDTDLALLDTHYYGGIKKYQWTAIPLALHGVFVDAEGEKTEIRLGEDDGDPVFTITDLLPHLAREQMQKKAAEAVDGEDLDVLAGSRPYKDEKAKDKVKLLLLSILNKQYGITEESFASAELELVPAFKARDVGFDRSMIGGYGHDDRSCAYPALMALLENAGHAAPRRTAVCYLSDKEEIGSVGNTGAQSWALQSFIAGLSGEANLRKCLEKSAMLSADVGAAIDPTYASVFDKKNCCALGKGLILTKYTGSGGKGGASDANAEFLSRVLSVMNRNNIPWQFGELGKVDKGGGGTIALHAARLGIEVLDCGVPVLSMHSPFEVISKVDLYYCFQGYLAFLRDC